MVEHINHSKRILIDQDGVIADFESGFLSAWQQKYPDKYFVPLDQRTSFRIKEQYPLTDHEDVHNIYTAKGFIENLPPIPGAIQALKEILEADFTIKICTSPLNQYD